MYDGQEYQNVIRVLRTFSTWCQLVSTTDTDLSVERLQAISCAEDHNEDGTCCQTAALGHALESIGGFGSSGLVHVMVMHLGNSHIYRNTPHFRTFHLETQAYRGCS